MSSSRSVLVIGPSWIGDIVMAQALFTALMKDRPGIGIDLLAPEYARPLAARMREVRNFIPSPFSHGEFSPGKRRAFGRSLRGCYSEAYVLPGSWKSALVPLFAGIPRRCGYLREWRWGLLNDIRHLPADMKRKTARVYQGLCDPAVLVDAQRLNEPRLEIDSRNQARLLGSLNLAPGSFACLVPGAAFGPAKRWPARHFAALADILFKNGVPAVILGAPDESSLADEICSQTNCAINLAGKTDLDDVVDILAASRFTVANDSGLMHVASAAGSPVVALYGSTSPQDTPPLSANARTLSLGLMCSPCEKRACPLGHHDCMEKMDVDRVIAEVQALRAI